MAEPASQIPVPIRAILLPLDGSRLAEAAIPPTIAIARAFGAAVTLLHVLEADPPAEVHGESHLGNRADAIAYLDEVATRFAGLQVSVHVHAEPERDVSQSIVDHAEEIDADLIVLANHGRGGLRGLFFGRVAQQVLQRGRRPVLAVPVMERDGQPAAGAPARLAVLLNQTAESESVIPLAVRFATAFGASLHLILAVPTLGTVASDRSPTATLMPSATKEVLNLEEREGHAYLDEIAARLQGIGVPVTSAVVRGEPAASVVAEAERVGANLLALTTHARGGLSGLLSGSVGAKILARSNLPLLLVPAPQ